jgi:RNA polymerase sigma-70 factor, ECF subfamily
MAMERDSVVQVLLRERLRVMAIATAIVRDVHAADDIFQQVVLAALQAHGEFRANDHVLAWALRTARHRAIDLAQRRRLVPLPDDVLDQMEAQWADASSEVWVDRIEALHHCLDRVAGPTRDLLKMRYVDGLTAVAIAGRLKRSAEQQLSRIDQPARERIT